MKRKGGVDWLAGWVEGCGDGQSSSESPSACIYSKLGEDQTRGGYALGRSITITQVHSLGCFYTPAGASARGRRGLHGVWGGRSRGSRRANSTEAEKINFSSPIFC